MDIFQTGHFLDGHISDGHFLDGTYFRQHIKSGHFLDSGQYHFPKLKKQLKQLKIKVKLAIIKEE